MSILIIFIFLHRDHGDHLEIKTKCIMEEKLFNSVWLLIGSHLATTFVDFPHPEIKILSDCIEVYFTFSSFLKSIPSVGDSWRVFALDNNLVLVYTFEVDFSSSYLEL